jgi:hypothetical protein
MHARFRITQVFAAVFCASLLGMALFVSCAKNAAAPQSLPRIVIVTPSETAAPDAFHAAESFAKSPIEGKPSAEFLHLALPDKPKGESGVASFIVDAAADLRVRAIVVAPAVRGTAEGLRRAKEARKAGSELFCVVGGSSDDELAIESSADIIVDLDRVYRAYITVWAAKKMGARSLVAAYEREEASSPAALRERAIMSAAAADLGLGYAAMVAPEGVGDVAFVRAGSGAWLRQYGPDAAFYCSSRELVQSIISGAIGGGGMVVDAAGAASAGAYAAALGVDLSSAKGDSKKERALVEAAAAAVGMKGRLGLWDAADGDACVAGLSEFATRVIKGTAKKDEIKDLTAALDARTGSAWIADYDVDSSTGVKSANRILVRQDIYLLGKGYLQSALQQVPSKYLYIQASGE